MNFDNIIINEEDIKRSLIKSGINIEENLEHQKGASFFDCEGNEFDLPMNFDELESFLFEPLNVEVKYSSFEKSRECHFFDDGYDGKKAYIEKNQKLDYFELDNNTCIDTAA